MGLWKDRILEEKDKECIPLQTEEQAVASNPTEDAIRRLKQTALLATGLNTTGAVFSNKLTYVAGLAPNSANRAALKVGGSRVVGDTSRTLVIWEDIMEDILSCLH